MAPPLISIIVPSYNHARYLPARLESIRAQTLKDFELILLDDASPDGSVRILEAFAAQTPARLILNQQNSGSAFRQWNRGAELAGGRYLWIAESDDFAKPHLLERLAAILETNPRVNLAFCRSQVIDEEGKLSRFMPPSSRRDKRAIWERDFIENGREFLAEYLSFRSEIPNASAVLIRRQAFVEAGGADAEMRLCGDWLLWSKLLMRGDIGYVAEPLSFFRVAGGSSPRTAARQAHSALPEQLKVARFIREKLPLKAKVERDALLYFIQVWLEFVVFRVWKPGGWKEIRRVSSALSHYHSLFWLRIPGLILSRLFGWQIEDR